MGTIREVLDGMPARFVGIWIEKFKEVLGDDFEAQANDTFKTVVVSKIPDHNKAEFERLVGEQKYTCTFV